jgi:hypothetical protein
MTLLLLFSPSYTALAPIYVYTEKTYDLQVFVVALDGISHHGVNSTDSILKAAYDTRNVLNMSGVDTSWESFCIQSEIWPPLLLPEPGVYCGIRVDIDVKEVGDWAFYESVVKYVPNAIVVNAHGETLPVPSGYSWQGWIDEIADAMLFRNLTWVHTAGYPFQYAWLQDSGEVFLNETGFQQLMKHIGKPNITCWPEGSEEELLHESMDNPLIDSSWSAMCPSHVSLGKPLKASDFEKWQIKQSWGAEYFPIATVRFASSQEETEHFGFYVHIGTYNTYDIDKNPTTYEPDYLRGFVGTALAIWFVAGRTVAWETISNAERAIAQAEAEGRTKLSNFQLGWVFNEYLNDIFGNKNGTIRDAKTLLENARSIYSKSWYLGHFMAFPSAMLAEDAATSAVKPNFTETYGSAILATCAAAAGTGIIGAGGLLIRRKRNHTK